MSDKIRVSLQPSTIEVEADGAPQEVVLSVQNVADYVDQYSIELGGLDARWYTLPLSSVSLFPQDRDEVRIQIHPRKDGGAKAGEYPFSVRVVSRAAPGESTVVEGKLEIRAFAVFVAEIVPPSKVVCRRKAEFRIRIINRGNVDISLAPSAADREEGCRFAFQPPKPTIPAGTPVSSTEMRLIARPRRSFWIGPTKQYEVTLTLAPEKAKGERKTLSCQVVHRPLLPSWRPVWRWTKRLALVLALIIAGLLGAQAIEGEGGIDALPNAAGRWVAETRGSLQDLFGLPRDQPSPKPTSGPPTKMGADARPPAQTATTHEIAPPFAPAFQAHRDLVGRAIEPATTDKDGNLHQATEGGLFVWWKHQETVYFFSKAERGLFQFKNGVLRPLAGAE